MRIIGMIFISALLITSCKEQKIPDSTGFITSGDPAVVFTGRVKKTDSATIVYWPGTSVKLRFRGSGMKMVLKDAHKKNYYNIILDGKLLKVINPDSVKTTYTLVSGLPEKEHSLEVFKRTEWDQGPTVIYGFIPEKGTKLLDAEKRPERTIEFFGNSITAGYANEDLKADSPEGIYTNNYMSYAAITARHFNANYYCTARGGIGIMVSWFPLIMGEMYKRLDPQDPDSQWDFSKVTPEIVVINLFQNDSWLIENPDYPEFKHRFGKTKPGKEFIIDSYADFLKKIRSEYPEARIICTLGTMDATKEGSAWPGYVKTAVKKMNDPEIYTLFFPHQKYPGHPEVRTHKKMAELLIGFIDEHALWGEK